MLHPLLSCVFALLNNDAESVPLNFTSRAAYITEANAVSLPLNYTKEIDLCACLRVFRISHHDYTAEARDSYAATLRAYAQTVDNLRRKANAFTSAARHALLHSYWLR